MRAGLAPRPAAACRHDHLPPLLPTHSKRCFPSGPTLPHTGFPHTPPPARRLVWTAALHKRFMEALDKVGGVDRALPKAVMRVRLLSGVGMIQAPA